MTAGVKPPRSNPASFRDAGIGAEGLVVFLESPDVDFCVACLCTGG